MKVLTVVDAACLMAKQLGKHVMYIASNIDYDDVPIEEVLKAAPYLDFEDNIQATIDGNAILVFDSEAEMEKYFNLTVGDDGPTESNSYNGIARVYALTIGPDGQTMNENT